MSDTRNSAATCRIAGRATAAHDQRAANAGDPGLGWRPGVASRRQRGYGPRPGHDRGVARENRARPARRSCILDITGVPVVDTAVAKHLLETVSAARLLGAEVLIVGLTSRMAMTLVHLGVDLGGVTTRTTLARGLQLAFARLGLEVVRPPGSTGGPARVENQTS